MENKAEVDAVTIERRAGKMMLTMEKLSMGGHGKVLSIEVIGSDLRCTEDHPVCHIENGL